MPDSNPLGARGRLSEDEYFRKRDRELLEKLRRTSAVEQARQELAAQTGLQAGDVDALQSLGFTPDTIPLLPLLPLVQVAWAEGGVSDAERALIVRLARSRGIDADSPADRQLATWLTTRPEPHVFAGASRLIGAMLDAPTAAQQQLSADEIVRLCQEIAAASGGLLGMRRVSAEEQTLLTTIARDLKARRP